MASGLSRLASDLRKSGDDVEKEASAVIKRGAMNIKRGWKSNAKSSSGAPWAPYYPNSITFDEDRTGPLLNAEIGPDKNLPQGPLGNLLEFGSVNNPPHNDGGRALRAEAPKYIANMRKVAGFDL